MISKKIISFKPALGKFVCIASIGGKEFLRYIFAKDWNEAESKAKSFDWKLMGKFEEEI